MRATVRGLRWALAASLLVCGTAHSDVRRPAVVLDLTAPSPIVELTPPPSVEAITIFGSGAGPASTVPLGPIITRAALSTGVPENFLLRLLRQESGLNPQAVSPKGALGIAQFMPATAVERGVGDPFDPEKAIPKAAELLLDLQRRYGNWGLAAAAYNAGPGRVDAWLLGRAGLPQETIAYVAKITGTDVVVWAAGQRQPGLRSMLYTSLASNPLASNPLASTGFGEAGLMMSLMERAPKAGGSSFTIGLPGGMAASGAPPTRRTAAAPKHASRGPASRSDPLNPCAALLNQSTSCIAYSRY